MDRRNERENQGLDQGSEQNGPQRPDSGQLNALERVYEHFRRVPVRYLDIFIWLCVAALVIVVAAGVLKARGIL